MGNFTLPPEATDNNLFGIRGGLVIEALIRI